MKRVLTAFAALAAAAAFANGVKSANVVGYQTSSISAGIYYMITTQFDAPGGTGSGIAIKDLITGNLPYGAEMQVRLPAGGYDIYKYIEEAYDETLDDFVPGWADGGENLATVPLTPGATFWLRVETPCAVTIAGQILADTSKTVTVNAGIFSMIGNAYPAPVNPNDLEWANLTYNDELQVRLEAGGYDIYKYIEEAYDETIDDFVPGWADGGENLVSTAILNPGRGAWINPAKAVSVTWESPL